jgi:hypothetical protein
MERLEREKYESRNNNRTHNRLPFRKRGVGFKLSMKEGSGGMANRLKGNE